MQNSVLKNLALGLLMVLSSLTATGQSLTFHLAKADSLFQQKKYTQSFELYQSIFTQKQYSPAMLLKMAYIEEGLHHVAQAIYYLNLYYLATNDYSALKKMRELAETHKLSGYESFETERLILPYRQYGALVTLALTAVLFILAALITYRKFRRASTGVSWIALCFFSVALLVHNNFHFKQQAIIAQPDTYLMTGPSSGASIETRVDEGHRVTVIGKTDIWVKVVWDGKEVYIKETNLLPVVL